MTRQRTLYKCMKASMTGNKGFALFYALLVSSLALAIGAAIFDITLREIDLASAATQSQYAVFIADTAGECALYWDNKCTGTGCNSNGSVFATSSASTATPANSNFVCDGVDVTSSTAGWAVSANASSATTTFNLTGITFHNQTPCAFVQVVKSGTPVTTTVTAHGYNTCVAGVTQLERVFQINY